MSNKYYDEKYKDHLVFFDDIEWLTPYEYIQKYPLYAGAYIKDLVKDEVPFKTKLPFIYRVKHPYGDSMYLGDKAREDNTQCFCVGGGRVYL